MIIVLVLLLVSSSCICVDGQHIVNVMLFNKPNDLNHDYLGCLRPHSSRGPQTHASHAKLTDYLGLFSLLR